MIGVRVTTNDGSSTTVEADDYVVDESGDLKVSGGGEELLTWPAGEWVLVDTFGVRLAPQWPPAALELVIESAAYVLGYRFGHEARELSEPEAFEHWRYNDLDTFAAQVFATIGLDVDDCENRAEADAVREVIAQHFHVRRNLDA